MFVINANPASSSSTSIISDGIANPSRQFIKAADNNTIAFPVWGGLNKQYIVQGDYIETPDDFDMQDMVGSTTINKIVTIPREVTMMSTGNYAGANSGQLSNATPTLNNSSGGVIYFDDGIGSTSTTTATTTIRIATFEELKGSLTVGESIRHLVPEYFMQGMYGVTCNVNGRLTVNWKLMRANGTLVTIGSDSSNTVNLQSEGVKSNLFKRVFEFSGSGIITQDGDRIVIEVEHYLSGVITGSTSSYGVKFGMISNQYTYSTDPTITLPLLEISARTV